MAKKLQGKSGSSRSMTPRSRSSSKESSASKSRPSALAALAASTLSQERMDGSTTKRKHATLPESNIMPQDIEGKGGARKAVGSMSDAGKRVSRQQKDISIREGTPDIKEDDMLVPKPKPPDVMDDTIKFEYLLFGALFRCSQAPNDKEKPGPGKADSRRGSLQSNSGLIGELSSGEPESISGPVVVRPVSRPISRPPRGQGEEQFIGDLNTTAGRLERCPLTPPPLSSFAMHLAEKLETMMTSGQDQPRM